MRKLLKSKKALSPVVAAIILIAVTVAVSIAVAAWMGSMTFNFMETEEMTIITGSIPSTLDGVSMSAINTGTSNVILTAVSVTGQGVTGASITSTTIPSTGVETPIAITLTGTAVAGNTYLVELVSTKGNKWTYTVVA